MYVADEGGDLTSNCHAAAASSFLVGTSDDHNEGWYLFELPMRRFTLKGTASDDDLTAMRWFRIHVQHAPNSTIALAIGEFGFYTSPWSGARFLVRADTHGPTSTANALDALDYAASNGVPICVAIGQGHNNCFSEAQLRQIATYHPLSFYANGYGGCWQNKTIAEKEACIAAGRAFALAYDLPPQAGRIAHLTCGGGWTGGDTERFLSGDLDFAAGKARWDNVLHPIVGAGDVETGYLPWSYFIHATDGSLTSDLADLIADAQAINGLIVVGTHLETANDISTLKADLDALLEAGMVPVTWDDLREGW